MKRLVAATAIGAIAVLGAAGCSSSSTSSPSSSPATSSPSTSTSASALPGYTPEQGTAFATQFAKSLQGKNFTPEQIKAIGSCAWRGITTTIQYSDFTAYGQDATSATGQQVSSELQTIAKACETNPSAY